MPIWFSVEINPDYFVGGEAKLDLARATKVIQSKIAEPLRLPLMDAAAGIIAIVNAHMMQILRVVSVSRGLDPRAFSLVAFGGAGPLHAADLAAELGLSKVIIPEAPGVFSALGLLWADLRAGFQHDRPQKPEFRKYYRSADHARSTRKGRRAVAWQGEGAGRAARTNALGGYALSAAEL